jgi:hypothetical protein
MDSTKSVMGHVMPNLCFCNRWDLSVTYCILVRPAHKTSTHYFSWSGGPCALSIKSAVGHNRPNLCFCFQWDLWVT